MVVFLKSVEFISKLLRLLLSMSNCTNEKKAFLLIFPSTPYLHSLSPALLSLLCQVKRYNYYKYNKFTNINNVHYQCFTWTILQCLKTYMYIRGLLHYFSKITSFLPPPPQTYIMAAISLYLHVAFDCQPYTNIKPLRPPSSLNVTMTPHNMIIIIMHLQKWQADTLISYTSTLTIQQTR